VNLQEAIAFVREHGIVLESARGPVPSLAAAIAGGPVNGSWWSHPNAREIFQVTRALRASDAVLVCRLVGSKITFVHRSLWPALVRVAGQFPPDRLAQLRERHNPSGEHVLEEIAFPAWVPADTVAQAERLDGDAAWATLRSRAPGAFGAP
jgi:hypothetical protein